MNLCWKINGEVSTPDDIFEKVFMELDAPGIFIFGADEHYCGLCRVDFKRRIYSSFEDVAKYHVRCQLLILGGWDSCNHKRRHNTVTTLKEMGANDIVGVYVKSIEQSIKDDMDHEDKTKLKLIHKQRAKLESNPPTQDGLTYLIVISEEDK